MKLYCLFIYLLLGISFGYAQENTDKGNPVLPDQITSENLIQHIEANISSFPNNTQISIALINKDHTKYFGILKKNDTIQTINNKHNVFEIGSISKVFTSILFSHLINEKKISANDSLKNQFNFELESGKNIQLKQLTNHTSGLPRLPSNMMFLLSLNKDNPYKYYTSKLLEEYLQKEMILVNPLGEKYEYSNLGVGLLGYILTKKENKPYESLLQDYILKPLKMNNTSSILKNIDSSNLIKGLNKNGKVISNWDFTDALVGAGGIKSSVFDMEKFIRKNMQDNSVYNLIQKPTYTINENLKIGMGWHIYEKNESPILCHGGATGGYLSSVTIDKANKKAIIILSNVSADHPKSSNIEKLSFKLLKTLPNQAKP